MLINILFFYVIIYMVNKMKKDNKITNILTNICIYVFILLSNFFCINKILDSDLFFDLRSAKDILTYGLDFKDHMSMHEGLKYLYHHWLYDLIIYPIFKLGGAPLLFIFFVIVFFLFSLLAYTFINKHINNKLISLISTIILIYFTSIFYYPRVQSVSYLLMLLLFIIINKLYEKGEIKYSVISILISIFIVNIHFPMWILVPVFFLPYIVQIIIKYIKDKYNIKLLDNKFIIEDCKSKKLFIITFIMILLSCFISPYGILNYTFGFKVMNYYSTVYGNIGEMKHVSLLSYPFVAFLLVIALILIVSKKKIKLYDLFYLLGLGLYGLILYRNTVYLYTYFIIILTINIFSDFKFKNIKIKKLNVNENVIISTFIIMEVITIGMIINALDFKTFEYGIDHGGEPVETADYIVNNLDYKNMRLYNEFAQGSYLAYREIPVFIDSRVEVYLKEFNDKEDIIIDYFNMDFEELIDKYQFNYYLVGKDSKKYKYLKDNDKYELLNVEYGYYYLYKNKEA